MSASRNVNIDYEVLASACKFYSYYGYSQIETPWLVSEKSALATALDDSRGGTYVTDDGQHLVYSAEQGFVQMVLSGQLEPGKNYFSLSPCFRSGVPGGTHSKTFVELGLFSYFNNNRKDLASQAVNQFVEDARELFATRIKVLTRIVPITTGYNIEDVDGLELGSYGIKIIDGLYCTYGTGIALPRISIARRMVCHATNKRANICF